MRYDPLPVHQEQAEMCPSEQLPDDLGDERCAVCRRHLHPENNDWPFCSRPCREIDSDTAVLLLVGPPTSSAQGSSAA